MQTYTQLLKFLGDVMLKANPDALTAYSSSALAIWSEGGEWPAYDEAYSTFQLGKVERGMNVPYQSPRSINNLSTVLDGQFGQSTVVGLTLECGAGKSTRVVKSLHNLKLGVRTFVVEPSAAVAGGLVEYMSSEGTSCKFAAVAADIPSTRALVYVGVGCMLDALLRGVVRNTDVVVIDEAHCVTFVHVIVEKILSRMTMPVLMMTASTTPTIRGLRGVRLMSIPSMDSEVSDLLAKEEDRAVMVGVTENQTYAVPASALIGATLDLRVIYDTGLRPEPRYKSGILIEGERKATQLEILQMVGRVGRLGKGGTAYYNERARVMPAEGIPLYGIMERAIESVIGFDTTLERGKAIAAWKVSGILTESSSSSREASSTPEHVPVASLVAGDAHVEGSDTDEDGWKQISKQVGHGRNTSSSSSGSNKSITKFRRRHSGGVVTIEASVVDARTHKHVADVLPDPNWRPFKRSSDLSENELPSDSSVMRFIDWIRDAHSRGDMIVPMKFPRADPSVVGGLSKEEARLVLAGRMLPSFTEMELLSVTVLWNEVADATRGPMRVMHLTQFLDYFDSYSNYCKAKAGYR